MLTDKEIVTEPTDRKATTEASGFQMLPSCLLNALTAGEITPSAIATYTAVVSFCDAERTGHPYRRTIATRTHQTVRTVANHLSQLRDAGLIQTVADPYGGPSMYWVADPCGGCFSPGNEQPRPGQPTSRPQATSFLHKGTRSSELDSTPKGKGSFASNSESVTNPSPDKLDPTECAHNPIDPDGYCGACATQVTPDPKYPDEPIATGSPPDQLTLVELKK